MSHLLDRYKQVLEVKGISCSNYRSKELKRRMRGHFLDQLVIEKQNHPSKPELIYSSHLSVADIVKTSVSQQSSEDVEVDEDTRQDMEQDKATILQDKKATTVSDGSTLSAEKGRRIVMLEMEARSQQTGVVIPSNITAGPFVNLLPTIMTSTRKL
ncbi:unnamed protein product [Porites lobata]|uniref:Uncharacterized protein n=1 Tax=Porites lobata TaxID=104759 RepID=A0ABN8PDA0_9CNID|nr:unnamed protein product [Porites lobata]